MTRKQLFSGAIVLASITAAGWYMHTSASGHFQSASADPVQIESGPPDATPDLPGGDDHTTTQLLAQANRGEALAWLTDSTSPRGVARWDKNEAITLVKDFYAAGALKVSIVDTDIVDKTEVASQLVVELPANAQLRKRIFDCQAKFQAEYDEDPIPDSGQKYLYLTTD